MFVVAEDGQRERALALAVELRRAGLAADLDLAERSVKGQMKQANRAGAARAVILDRGGWRAASRHGDRRAAAGRPRQGEGGDRLSAPEFPSLRPNDYRDTWCGQVLPDRVGGEARVAGWVHRRRDHGGLIFVDLRDRTGIVQLVFDPDESSEAKELAHRLRAEDVLSAAGEVVRRDPETVNDSIPTGEVELRVKASDLIADADTPPFEIEGFSGEVGEEMRLRHRYLDLRREPMQRAIALRSRVASAMRGFFDSEGFLEIETPELTRSTPEGARDFLVPSRNEAGSFYALPQSPQLFKQLLMVSGFERYFQIARCFRDEAMRSDRQAEFTQLDVEMSFVTVEDVLDVNERMLAHVFERVGGPQLELPLQRLPYDEAIERYGTDRPDVRFGLELATLSDVVAGTEFKVFRSVVEGGGAVRGLNAGKREMPRSALDGLIGRAQELGAKGLVWAFREGDGWRSPTAKFLSEEELRGLNEALGAEEGDLLLLVADERSVADTVLAQLRLDLAERFDLIPEGEEKLLWIVDWPLFEYSEDEKRWDPLHHPFTAPDGRARSRRSRVGAGARLRRRLERPGARWGFDPRLRSRDAAPGVPRARDLRRGGGRALRVPARGPALRRAPARRHRLRPRPLRAAPRGRELDSRRDRVPEDGVGLRPAHRRPGSGRRDPAARPRGARARHPAGAETAAVSITPEEESLARRVLAAISDGDTERFGELVADDVEIHTARGTRRGRVEAIAWAAGKYDHLQRRLEIDELERSREGIVVRGRSEYVWNEGGEVADSSPVAIELRFADGKLARFRFLD